MLDDNSPNSPDIRVDLSLRTVVHIVGSRQKRPDLATNSLTSQCPFCVGGREAPAAYDVAWFVNRWPAMADDRCEVVLYAPEHEATMATLGVSAVRRIVDLWAQRSQALGERDDVAYVLIFENSGAAVGATISHPHGQIYAYDHVPDRLHRLFASNWVPDDQPARFVSQNNSFSCVVPWASPYPIALTIAPLHRVGDIASLDFQQRDDLAEILVDTLGRLHRLFAEPIPYMLWINQRPCDDSHSTAWLSIEIVSPWRSAGVTRFIAAAEIAAGEYFNPVIPEEIATILRDSTG